MSDAPLKTQVILDAERAATEAVRCGWESMAPKLPGWWQRPGPDGKAIVLELGDVVFASMQPATALVVIKEKPWWARRGFVAGLIALAGTCAALTPMLTDVINARGDPIKLLTAVASLIGVGSVMWFKLKGEAETKLVAQRAAQDAAGEKP